MNVAIEIHDSRVAEIAKRGSMVVVHFEFAYLHKSKGRPGVDAGTGWVQEARMTFADAEVSGDFPDWPCNLMDGELIVGSEHHRNRIPVPFDSATATELHLICDSLHMVKIVGHHTRLELVGEPRYVEEFRPKNCR